MNSLPRGAFSSQQAAQTKEKIPSGYNKYQISQYEPEQTELFKNQFAHLDPNSFLSKLAMGDESQFEEMEAPAMKQFSALQGNLGSRFSGMGMGSQKSSGFQNTMNTASQDFAGQLQANRMGLRKQAITDLMGLSNQVLNQRPYEKGLQEKPKSFLHEAGVGLAQGFGEGAGKAAGAWLGGG